MFPVLLGCTIDGAISTRILPTGIATAPTGSDFVTIPSRPPATVTIIDHPAPVTTSTPIIPVTSIISTPTKILIGAENTRICAKLPRRFNFRDTLNINYITHLRFVNEELLTFEGWSPRPALEARTRLSATSTASESLPIPGPNVSFRILLAAGQLNLASGELVTRTLDFAPLLSNPCGELCPLEILGQSPNEEWQLVQVSDWSENKIGIWLINADETIRLVPYVPGRSTWQWSIDDTLLWYVYSGTSYGLNALAVQLDSPIDIVPIEHDRANPLDPLYYLSAFSPRDKTVASTENPFEQGLPDIDELYIIALNQSPSTPDITEVAGLVTVIWNEATQSYLLEIVHEDGIEVRELDGNRILRVPLETIHMLFPALAEGNMELIGLSLGGNFALSHSGQYLAIAYEYGEIWVFDCQNPS